MIRHVLTLDVDDPICAPCATALGGTPHDKIATVSARPCGMCHQIRECVAVRDYTWSATTIRPEPVKRHQGKPWAAPDDHSELETLLTRPVSGVPIQQPTEK